MFSNILLVLGFVFPAPKSTTSGWHPITFSKSLKSKPLRFSFPDESFVAWRGENGMVHVKHDCCPHMGSKLSEGYVKDNCISCPYHGLLMGPYDNAHPDGYARELVGVTKEHQGIIWWTRTNNFDIPHCDDLDGHIDVQHEYLIKASFNDCWRNAADFHHPAVVHKNSFGNTLDSPTNVHHEWINEYTFRSTFEYISSESYKRITGKKTNNYHEFVLPSTTYNCVSNSENNKKMVIHVAMRAETPTTTRWFVSCKNTFANFPFSSNVIESMINKVVTEEDGAQLEKMEEDHVKMKHSYKIKLEHDDVIDSLASQTIPNILERKLIFISESQISGNKMTELAAPVCEELVAYNSSIAELMPLYMNTKWDVLIAHYKSPKTNTIDSALFE